MLCCPVAPGRASHVRALARIAATPQTRLHELLPWNWHAKTSVLKAA
jgi:hypothetical protein